MKKSIVKLSEIEDIQERVDKFFSVGKSARDLIAISKDYFNEGSYLSSFVVLMEFIEFFCSRLLYEVVRGKAFVGEKPKTKNILDKIIVNYSLGKYTLGSLVRVIRKETRGFFEDDFDPILDRLDEINEIRIRYIHLMAIMEYGSVSQLEKGTKQEIESRELFSLAEELSRFWLKIRRTINRGIVG